MQHDLNIRVDDDLKSTSFTVRDCSYYYMKMPVEDLILEVFPPSSNAPIIFKDLTEYFTKTITVNDLHLNSAGVYPIPDLPDGAYFLRYSVCPNLKVYIAYYYFRNVRLVQKYLDIVSQTLMNRQNLTSAQYSKKISTLLWYKELIDCSKYLAEEKLQIEAANLIYQEVDELLNNFNKCIEC